MYKCVNGKKRIFYIDQIRALAILLVVLAHVCRKFSDASAAGSWQWFFSTPMIDFAVLGVPLFLMISGALLLNRDYGLKDFLKRRFSRILIPFIPWALLLPLLLMFIQNDPWSLSGYVRIFLDDQYWFVWMLIGVYLFLPVINSFVKEYGIRGLEYFLAVWIAVLCLNTVGLYPFHQLELSYFAGFLGYFVLGYYLANREFGISDEKMILIGFLLFSVFTLINMHHTVTAGLLKGKVIYYSYKTIICALQSSGLFLIFRYWAVYSSKNNNSIVDKVYSIFRDSFLFKIIFALSTYSYGIFLVHYFPLNTFRYINQNMIPIFSFNPVIWLPIIYIAVVGIAFIIVYICDRIPYLREISGSH